MHTRQQERWQEAGHALAQAREGEEEGDGEELEREEEERGGPGAMDRQRPGRQKARPRCRQSEKESSILRICLESIGPAKDTLSNCFINGSRIRKFKFRVRDLLVSDSLGSDLEVWP